jgi:hypothetical protein
VRGGEIEREEKYLSVDLLATRIVIVSVPVKNIMLKINTK